MPYIYNEEPVFGIPRRNWHWGSGYDFLYEKIHRLEQRVSALENKKPTNTSKEE